MIDKIKCLFGYHKRINRRLYDTMGFLVGSSDFCKICDKILEPEPTCLLRDE